jgi:pyruvate dehydrogenase E1 component alpha subunit
MKNLMTPEELIAFEDDIADCFNNKMIRAPIHLYFGNEKQMIEIFKEVQPDDWCICSWRSHYQCLLKGMSPEKVKADILDGRSIEMCNKEYKIFSSAIVGGNVPIALGIAMDIKRKGGSEKVWVFVGDMTSTLGAFREAVDYARNFDLPITFVIEDNFKSVCTNTREVWRYSSKPGGYPYFPWDDDDDFMTDEETGILKWDNKVLYYKYDLHQKWKHAGTGQRIVF